MKRGIKKSILVFIATVLFAGGVSIGETASFNFGGGKDLVTILEDNIFSSFSTEPTMYKFDVIDMCNGSLLLECRVSSEFGWRVHPKRRRRHMHTGIDLETTKGSPIFAPADGVVREAGRSRGYGKMVELDHGFAWSTRYAHMSKIHVKDGQNVRKGDLIGEVGSTGVSTGPHLHFEMNYFGQHVNPRSYYASLRNIREPSFASANR